MSFKLSEINARAAADPAGFALECEDRFNHQITKAADKIAAHRTENPIVFLSGPSGSGKTTTANKICDELERGGVLAHTVSLDNYFLTLDPETAPRTKDGEFDRESPQCLDFELLNKHFHALEHGEEIVIPHFNFKTQSRDSKKNKPLKLGRDEIAIFEGIHALNDMITLEHPKAFKLYISARSSIDTGEGEAHFKGTWMRLMRRVVRDEFFRGTGAHSTLGMWANVRHGEKKYISPFKNKADILFDSAMPYEVPVMKRFAELVFSKVQDGVERFHELSLVLPALSAFTDIDPVVVPANSILREFIGGGIYKY